MGAKENTLVWDTGSVLRKMTLSVWSWFRPLPAQRPEPVSGPLYPSVSLL